jgi:hypothetical protein
MAWAARGVPPSHRYSMLQMVNDTVPSRQVTFVASHAYERSAVRRHTVELHCSAHLHVL